MRSRAVLLVVSVVFAIGLTTTAGAGATKSYPATSRSMYEPSTDATALYDQGCKAASGWVAGSNGLVILDFGRVAHSKTKHSYGTYDFSLRFASDTDILAAAESYANGFHACRASGFSGRLRLALGTSNFDPSARRFGVPHFRAAGKAFGKTVNALHDFLRGSGFSEIAAGGADDAESAWDRGFAATHGFLAGYAAMSSYPLFDFGGFSGGGWSYRQEYFAARGAGPDRPVAEVYVAHQAEEWESLSLWAVDHEGHKLNIVGVMSQYPDGGYRPRKSYRVMLQALGSSAATSQDSISFITRIGSA